MYPLCISLIYASNYKFCIFCCWKKKSDLFIYEYFKFDETYNDKYKCKFSVKIDKKTLQLKDRN